MHNLMGAASFLIGIVQPFSAAFNALGESLQRTELNASVFIVQFPPDPHTVQLWIDIPFDGMTIWELVDPVNYTVEENMIIVDPAFISSNFEARLQITYLPL